MTRFWWVRHGPTHAKGMVGWSDLPADLSDSAALARLSGFLPTRAVVVSSDLSRARATADAITGGRSRLPDDADLREMHFGDWEMKHFDQVSATDAELVRRFYETPGTIRAPGGDSWNDLSARVGVAVDRLARAHPGGDIIVVSHMGAILTQVQRALNLTAYETLAHRIDNLSVTEITMRADGWRAGRINHHP